MSFFLSIKRKTFTKDVDDDDDDDHRDGGEEAFGLEISSGGFRGFGWLLIDKVAPCTEVEVFQYRRNRLIYCDGPLSFKLGGVMVSVVMYVNVKILVLWCTTLTRTRTQ